MNTVNDFINFLRIFNALRNGSYEDRKAVMTNEADVKFMAKLVEDGLFDKWLEIAEELIGRF